MWQSILQINQWKPWLQLVSPTLIEVMPVSSFGSVMGKLLRSGMNQSGLNHATEQRQGTLLNSAIPVTLERCDQLVGTKLSLRERGNSILKLYFHQLYNPGSILLDLRAERFSDCDQGLLWKPTRMYINFDPDFLSALRDVYSGFYLNNIAKFYLGIEKLQLAGAEEIMRQHFNVSASGDTAFRLDHFGQSFVRIFSYCQNHRIRLHKDFVALGIYLLGLYQHMEKLGGTWDVRSAFIEGAQI